MTDAKFHFSPRSNRAHEIQWREWGDEPFRESALTGKPVLLSLSAVWCHWCHVMDETSYSDQGVIDFINEHYIPVRVDNDQRPDINTRYNMGGWPTTAFLTAEGEVLAGATYVPPDQMKEILPQVNVHYRSNRDELAAKATELRLRRAAAAGQDAGGELTPEIFDQVVAAIGSNYDPMYGGFGDHPKFPHTDAIDLLLYAHRRNNDPDVLHMARKTLEMMGRGEVFDQEWGGFFRYATRRDWSEPHYEKMLEDNAGLLRNVLSLYRITGNEEHAEIARRTIDYLEWKLRDHYRGYFYGSQDADEEFYKLPKEGRERAEEPYIDRICYTSWNAMAISAYLEASWTLTSAHPEVSKDDWDDLRATAIKALHFLWTNLRDAETGSMYRFLTPESGAVPQVPGLLGDQAYTARALLDAHEVTGDSKYLEQALELARLVVHRFIDREHGPPAGFFDTWDEASDVGRLRDRQKSLQDNAVCAEVFMRLGHLLRDDEDLDIAKGTLEGFAGQYMQMGYFAEGYAKHVDLVLNPPPEINIVGDGESTTDLHNAALRLEAPARIVQVLDPSRDAERLSALFLPPDPAPAAYVCAGTTCSAPVTDPVGLRAALRDMMTAAAGGVREL